MKGRSLTLTPRVKPGAGSNPSPIEGGGNFERASGAQSGPAA